MRASAALLFGCRIRAGTPALISRNGKDWTEAFPEIAESAAALGVRHALLDGEIAIVLPDGRTSFQALRNAFSGGARAGLVYFVFDLLHLEGETLNARPLEAMTRHDPALYTTAFAKAGRERKLDPQAWSVLTIEKRLSRLRRDPWTDYWSSKQRLPARAMAAL